MIRLTIGTSEEVLSGVPLSKMARNSKTTSSLHNFAMRGNARRLRKYSCRLQTGAEAVKCQYPLVLRIETETDQNPLLRYTKYGAIFGEM